MSNADRDFIIRIGDAVHTYGSFDPAEFMRNEDESHRMLRMKDKGYFSTSSGGKWFFSEEGLAAYHASQEQREEEAEENHRREAQQQREDKRYRKDARRSWIHLGITITSDILGILLGAYLAHATSWFDWLDKLIH